MGYCGSQVCATRYTSVKSQPDDFLLGNQLSGFCADRYPSLVFHLHSASDRAVPSLILVLHPFADSKARIYDVLNFCRGGDQSSRSPLRTSTTPSRLYQGFVQLITGDEVAVPGAHCARNS